MKTFISEYLKNIIKRGGHEDFFNTTKFKLAILDKSCHNIIVIMDIFYN